jgi:hypothetical protein
MAALPFSKKVRRIGLVALVTLTGVVWHGRKLRRLRTAGHLEWPLEVRKFVRMLRSRGSAVRSVRREGLPTRRGWMVEWDTGTLFFPDEARGDPL